MVIEQLLGPVPLATFMEEHFLRLPFARPGGCHNLIPAGMSERVETILAVPSADILVGREGRRWDGKLPLAPAEARALLAEGYTLGIRHAERHDPDLAALAEGFRHDFRAPVDLHLYCTPAGHPGFGWHYDAEDVFVLQIEGSKDWELRKNTVNPWPLVETLPENMRHEREVMPVMRCTLAAGDWLYIPAGYWHRTRAEQESLSLSAGVLSAAAIDVFDFLRAHLLSSLRWRQRLPPAGAASPLGPGQLLDRYRAIFADLGEDLAGLLRQEELVRAFLVQRRDSHRTGSPAAPP